MSRRAGPRRASPVISLRPRSLSVTSSGYAPRAVTARLRAGFFALGVVAISCASRGPLDPGLRESAIVGALVRADRREIVGRAPLVAGKYARMARSLYDFYRGSMPIFRADLADSRMRVAWTRFDVPGELPFSIGDAHPENFGLLLGPDGVLALEPNDLDAADRHPYHLDLRRLTVGLALASRRARLDEAALSAVLRAALESYVDTVEAIAEGTYEPRRITSGTDPILADLFRRGARDLAARRELVELTEMRSGARRFVRGAPDADDPEHVLSDLPGWAIAALPETLESYRRGLSDPPPPEFFALLDAVREHGSGVASWTRIRALVLVRGPTDAPDDDIVLEIKEITQSGANGPLPPGVYADDEPDRIRRAARGAWSRPDAEPLWGASRWMGIPVQIRLESEAQKTFRASRLEGDRARVESLAAFAAVVGEILARVQGARALGADGSFPRRFASRIGALRDAFIADEIEVAREHAHVVELDWMLFRNALRTRGPTLGLVGEEPAQRRDLELRDLYGTPAEVQPWE